MLLTSMVLMSPSESVSCSNMLGRRTFETASVRSMTSTRHLHSVSLVSDTIRVLPFMK